MIQKNIKEDVEVEEKNACTITPTQTRVCYKVRSLGIESNIAYLEATIRKFDFRGTEAVHSLCWKTNRGIHLSSRCQSLNLIRLCC